MASLVVIIALIPATFLLFIVFLSLTASEKSKACKRLPPGNRLYVPLIGETFSFFKPRSPTTLGDYMERRMSKFGKIFMSNLLGNKVIVSAEGEFNQFVSKNEPKLFGPGWWAAFEKVAGSDSISLAVGDAHKAMRSTLLEFLSPGRLRSVFLPAADELASRLIKSWTEGSVISVATEATKFSLSLMVKNIVSLNPGDPEIEKLRMEYRMFVDGLSSFPVSVPGTPYWKAFKARERVVKYFQQEVEGRTGKKGDRHPKTDADDFVGWLIKNTDFSAQKIGNFLLGLLFAGHDTTSRAIPLMIYFLEGCPKALEHLREEHLQLLRSRKKEGAIALTWDDHKSLKFTKCVINETLRLGNVSNFVQKKATKDVEYKGYVIPKGQKVLVHISAMHLDPSIYEDAEHFNPWRWLSSDVKLTNNFMPFGGGIRMCPGAELARLEMSVFLHHLILNYDWELVEPDHPMMIPGTKFPKGLPVKVRAASIY